MDTGSRSSRTRLIHAALLGVLAVLSGCGREAPSGAGQTLRFGVGSRALSSVLGALAQHYRHAIANVTIDAVVLDQPSSIKALQDGQIDLTVATADAAYFAYREPEGSPSRLRALAAIYDVQLHVLVSRGSGIRHIADLSGHEVHVLTTQPVAPLAASYFGLKPDPRLWSAEQVPVDAHTQTLLDVGTGDVEAAIFATTAPAQPVSTSAARGAYLVPVEGPAAARLLRENPFVRPVAIRANTYPGQSTTINTVGVDRLVMCRTDLSEGAAYTLTKKLFEVLPGLAQQHPVLLQMDVEHAPATSIPLHPGAARYYREWELSR